MIKKIIVLGFVIGSFFSTVASAHLQIKELSDPCNQFSYVPAKFKALGIIPECIA